MTAAVQSAESHGAGLRGPLARGGALLRRAPRALGKLLLGLAGRVLRNPRLRLILILVLLLTAIPVYCLGVILMRPKPPKITLAAALAALDADQDVLASYHATRLFEAEVYAPWNHGGPAYVLGILAARRGEVAEGAKQHDYRALAVSYLREAHQQGFPPGREAHGLFTLGATLAKLGRHAESIEPLRNALAAIERDASAHDAEHAGTEHVGQFGIRNSEFGIGDAPGRSAANSAFRIPHSAFDTEIHRLLCAAYRRSPKPRLNDALEQSTQYLAAGDLSGAERERGLLDRAHVHYELGQAQACRKTLAEIAGSEQLAAARLLEAQLLLLEARQLNGAPAFDASSPHSAGDEATSAPSASPLSKQSSHDTASGAEAKTALRPKPNAAALEKYRQALAVLEAVRGRDALAADVPLDALYLLGECRFEMGDDTAAYQLFREVAQRGTGEPAVAPSELRRAELLLRQAQPTDAMLALQPALRLARPPEEYDQPWLPLSEFRSRVTAFHAELLSSGEFGLAVRLAQQVYPLFAREEQTRLLAETHQACAQRLEEEGHKRRGETDTSREERREHHRRAAEAFYRLARLEYATPRYPDYLWSAAQNYQAAGAYSLAEPLLQAYLSHDVSRQNRPQALLALAQVQMALGNPRGAAATLRECRDRFPRDPIVYSARLLAADAYLAIEDYDEARQALQDNLDGGELTPASGEWRDSLFALGRLHALRQEWSQAIQVLEEAVARYPQSPRLLQAHYLIADAHLRRAKQHQAKSHTPSDEQRTLSERQRQAELEAGLAHLRQVVEAGDSTPNHDTDALDRSARRSASFAQVTTLIELGRPEEAVRACADLINRYQDAPEALEAYVQIAAGLRRLKRSDEALAALAQARTALDKLPADTSFAGTTNKSKDEWRKCLDWMAKE